MPLVRRTTGFFPCAAVFAFINCLFCSTSLSPLPYVPVILFSGIVNTDSLSYPGNRSHPNSCEMRGDCVRMYFYSEDYSQGSTNHGDQMRIDVYGLDSQFITERRAIFVMTRYDKGITTPTYNIVPSDTLNDYNNLHMVVESFEWHGGGNVGIKDMTAQARPLGQFGSEPLTIVRGRISGRIQ